MDNGLEDGLARPRKIGRAKRIDDSQARYIEYAKRTFPKNLTLDGLRIVIDCANGAAYKVAPLILWELGAEVIEIGTEPNGVNINHECGSTFPESMQRKVRERRADFGIALDGDADRVVMADERGQSHRRRPDSGADRALLVASTGELKGGGVVGTVMSNAGLERYLKVTRSQARALACRRPLRHRPDVGKAASMSAANNPATSFSAISRRRATASLLRSRFWACSPKSKRPASEAAHIFEPCRR